MSSNWRIYAALAWAVLVVEGWSGLQNLRVERESEASTGWAATAGVVSSARVVEGTTGWRYTRRCDRPEVCFEYKVAGATHSSCRATFAETCGAQAARRLIARFPSQQEIQVWYDPADPDAAVLEPGSWNRARSLRFSGVLAGGALLFALFATIQFLRPPKQPPLT